ncbi:hypothetical protein [Moraxella nasicaprae]|uniref:Uncharacterized protein n=1 Tax=Moraxella nasicaprae TaxID=2904122 RepID=A0ABY6F1P9_9GAMM|nr:hypothetical protein [Moraxella nasicaprae]UXZ04019.1 hypothetical protein LU297_05170 [Moraxella nasicaprae]
MIEFFYFFFVGGFIVRLENNDHYNWQQERQITAFYTLSKGDIVIATTRHTKEIYVGVVANARSYDACVV